MSSVGIWVINLIWIALAGDPCSTARNELTLMH